MQGPRFHRLRPRPMVAIFLALAVLFSGVSPALAGDGPAPPPPTDLTRPEQPAPEAPAPAPLPQPEEPEGEAPEGPHLGQPAVSQEQAVAVARETFGIPAELGEPRVNLWQSSDSRSRSYWNLSWNTAEGVEPALRYHVEVDAQTGEIRSFSFSRQEADPPPLAYTEDEAVAEARRWLERLASAYLGSLQFQEQRLGGAYFYKGEAPTYSFFWERVEAGIPVAGQGTHLTIDARTGELTQYRLDWDTQATFDRPEALLKTADAEAAFRGAVPVGLVYRRFWDPVTNEPEWKLVYQPLRGYPLVDAVTGDLTDTRGEAYGPLAWDELQPLPAPAQRYVQPEEPLTQEEALALAQAVTGMEGPPTQVRYAEEGGERPRQTYHFTWHPTGEGKPEPLEPGQRMYDVTIDALQGLVAGYNSWTPGAEEPEERPDAISREEAAHIAEAFLLEFRPDLVSHLRVLPQEPHERSWCRPPDQPQEEGDDRRVCDRYTFRYQHFVGGIPVNGEHAWVEVDPWTGAVVNFQPGGEALQDPETELPEPEGVIAPDEALAALLEHAGLRLEWRSFAPDVWIQRDRAAGEEESQPAPVFAPLLPAGFSAVDARTGHLLNHQGQDLNLLALRPEDVVGHWAQKEIELLLKRQVFTVEPDGHFYPDRQVTRGEAARWLVLAKGLRPYVATQYSFADFAAAAGDMSEQKRLAAQYAEAALRAGIVTRDDLGETFGPEEPVTREEFALWAVRAMGYGAIAEMDVMIPLGHTDAAAVGERYQNAVGILAGLKVIQREGTFRPQDPITRAEAARILYAVSTEVRER